MTSFTLDTQIVASLVSQQGPVTYRFALSAAERGRLALRFGFTAVEKLRGHLTVLPIGEECWELKGRIKGVVIQSCVITGDCVEEVVSFDIDERYVASLKDKGEIDALGINLELLEDGVIPLGEVVAQTLAVNVVAWPRHPNAPDMSSETDGLQKNNPFSKLSELQK